MPRAKAAKVGDVLGAAQLSRIADSLERLVSLLERFALKAGLNVDPLGVDIDESFLGDQPDLTDEEAEALRAATPPAPPHQ